MPLHCDHYHTPDRSSSGVELKELAWEGGKEGRREGGWEDGREEDGREEGERERREEGRESGEKKLNIWNGGMTYDHITDMLCFMHPSSLPPSLFLLLPSPPSSLPDVL